MVDKIGFVGVGKMGGPMARRLIAAGHRLVVYDSNAAAAAALAAQGATAASSPAEVASQARIVLVSLPTPEVVRLVALGEEGLVTGTALKAYVDLSTSGPVVAAEVAAALEARGIAMLDAPVSGGVRGAVNGTLAIMAAGPTKLLAELQPLLACLGRVFCVGDRPGLGQVMKLANNMLSATAMAASAEVMAMGVKAGLDPRVMIEVINAGTGGHTLGIQAVRVWTRRGWVVLASDASHLYANMEQGRPYPIIYNLGDMLEGYGTLRKLASSPAHVIPGHDPLVLARYPAPRPELAGIVARLDADPL
jgi:3-hydroxyisobutyrate dehydrogenase-like beta-hydroxyacid dehydrogenase